MLEDGKTGAELRELLGLDPVTLVIKKYRFIWFGLVEHKDDTVWVWYDDGGVWSLFSWHSGLNTIINRPQCLLG